MHQDKDLEDLRRDMETIVLSSRTPVRPRLSAEERACLDRIRERRRCAMRSRSPVRPVKPRLAFRLRRWLRRALAPLF